ncbi:hypothetical protein SLS62_003579 [Diatrype stigma]|uniref:Large ribosomal subunit protein mL50 n=1 Tax=Diatrype stigma TaxID=117547 RepID=A0AAN9UUV8_9PEZI
MSSLIHVLKQQQQEGPDEGELTATPPAEAEEYDAAYASPELEDPSSSSSTTPTLYKTPPRRTRAARPADVEVEDPSYVAATTAEGLQAVGGFTGWWDRRENWGGDFAGFRPPGQAGRVNNPALLEAAARRAVVEALALRQAGREADLVSVWPLEDQGEGEGARQFLGVNLVVSSGGGSGGKGEKVELSGDVEGLVESLTWKDSSAIAVAEKKTFLSPKEAAEVRESWDKSWKNVPLDDARIKFAVTKRIFQLTGQLIPDHRLSEITSVGVLLAVLQKPPKPQTLSDELAKRQPALAQELPNVAFAAKRVTRGDRERAVGRFKLIEEEFKKRDLPLDGHGYAQKNKERSWLSGGT